MHNIYFEILKSPDKPSWMWRLDYKIEYYNIFAQTQISILKKLLLVLWQTINTMRFNQNITFLTCARITEEKEDYRNHLYRFDSQSCYKRPSDISTDLDFIIFVHLNTCLNNLLRAFNKSFNLLRSATESVISHRPDLFHHRHVSFQGRCSYRKICCKPQSSSVFSSWCADRMCLNNLHTSSFCWCLFVFSVARQPWMFIELFHMLFACTRISADLWHHVSCDKQSNK